MGRPEFEVDPDILMEFIEGGHNRKSIAKQVGCSVPTLSKRIAELQEKSPVLLEYRTLQNLQLTELQHQILSRITIDKIDEAPLRDLVLAFKVLKDKEVDVDTDKKELKGLVGYLLEIEREEMERKRRESLGLPKATIVEDMTGIEDAEFGDISDVVKNLLDEVPD